MILKLTRWGGLYLMVILWIGGLFWELNLAISQTAHDILSLAILVFMGVLVNGWIQHHPANLLAFQTEEDEESADGSGRRSIGNRLSEK